MTGIVTTISIIELKTFSIPNAAPANAIVAIPDPINFSSCTQTNDCSTYPKGTKKKVVFAEMFGTLFVSRAIQGERVNQSDERAHFDR